MESKRGKGMSRLEKRIRYLKRALFIYGSITVLYSLFWEWSIGIIGSFNPYEMIGAVLGIEAGFGRVRSIKDGPRIIDIDIIFAENIVIETRNLTTPHPRYKERRFVLEPLMELYPDGHFYGYSFYGLSEKIKNQAIKKL